MAVSKTKFGTTKCCGKDIYKYEITNSKGMKACVINYGAILTELYVPDDKGEIKDVVLGFDKLEDYYENGSFFGATVGPSANRIANAKFTLDGKEYQLAVNDGPNNLHSDADEGYHKRYYDVAENDNSVTFCLEDDASMGFPGKKKVSVTYTVTEDNELKIYYDVESDKNTIINMTNHSYFNLLGHDAGRIENHVLTLAASKYTPVIPGAIPTGEYASVEGTVFDFTSPKRVGDNIEDDVEQLTMVKGYDHNFVLDATTGDVRKVAEVTCPGTSRVMEVYTDLPAIQFYAGNCIAPVAGKAGVSYGPRCGLCLETQFNPDTPNRPEWPSAVFGPDRKYQTTTIYKFS